MAELRLMAAALVVALVTVPAHAQEAARITLRSGEVVAGEIEGRFIQKHRSNADGKTGGYVIRQGSVILGIDKDGVHLRGHHDIELLSTGGLSMRMTGTAEKDLDASPLLGEITDEALQGDLNTLEERIIPKLRVKLAGGESKVVAVKDIVAFAPPKSDP
jgi:hypothetical protein